ncbi:MAG: OmpH family outer membrane protein [Puniceicoccales bacterium]|jgi:Skp family chaperone for outer membrane proteins|nr:OmpH family outer membrane protein [Puniceicoccales bacterium]
MKKLVSVLLFSCAFAGGAFAWPSSTKILSVDVQKVFDNFEKAKAAQAAYNEAVSVADKELREIYDEIVKINDEVKDLQAKADNAALTDTARSKFKAEAMTKTEELRKKDLEFGQLRQDLNKRLIERRQGEIADQSKDLEVVVAEIDKEKKADLVLNKFTSAIYVDDSLDISDLVIAKLNGKSNGKK